MLSAVKFAEEVLGKSVQSEGRSKRWYDLDFPCRRNLQTGCPQRYSTRGIVVDVVAVEESCEQACSICVRACVLSGGGGSGKLAAAGAELGRRRWLA